MMHPSNPDAARLNAAADLLAGGAALDQTDAASLLHYLSFDDGDADAVAGHVRMLRAASMLRRLFLLPVPDAPGLVFFGGEADPAILGKQPKGLPAKSLAGSGVTTQKAFESCVGEGIEYLSQFVQAGDAIERGPFTAYGANADAHVREF